MTRHVPAEWETHKAMWLGFPSHGDLWEDNLIPAQAEVAALARVLADIGHEQVKLMVMGAEARQSAQTLLGDVARIEIIDGQFGDIWFRDTGPIYAQDSGLLGVCFGSNGWGGKYALEYDDTVNKQIIAADKIQSETADFILEGGALDHDGFGTILTTRQCLLNPNRNKDWDEATAEAHLSRTLGAKKVIWLGDGLLNDHTDGHVDNLARFVAPGVVACPVAYGTDDPNAKIYDECAKQLAHSTDARGQKLQVVRIPSPGLYENEDGDIVPASHMNFLIANRCVIVPVYHQRPADLAVEALQALFSERKVLGLSSRAILTGGGSFHCITQQVPA